MRRVGADEKALTHFGVDRQHLGWLIDELIVGAHRLKLIDQLSHEVRELEKHGASHVEAVLAACRIRLRPILMTSLAFIMGVLPLVFSSGAGFEIRQAMGIAVFAGMLGVTLFGLFLTPVFYTVIGRLTHRTRVARHRTRLDVATAEGN